MFCTSLYFTIDFFSLFSNDNIPFNYVKQLTFFYRHLQSEYERLRGSRGSRSVSPTVTEEEEQEAPPTPCRDEEMLAEAKLLRQHKGRLEARMQILEDHNRQLEAQLHRLRQLLDEVTTAFFKNALKMAFVYLSNIIQHCYLYVSILNFLLKLVLKLFKTKQ